LFKEDNKHHFGDKTSMPVARDSILDKTSMPVPGAESQLPISHLVARDIFEQLL
jgi:hypothetical protein